MNSLIKAKGIGKLFFTTLLPVLLFMYACGGGGGGGETSAPQPESNQPAFIATDYYPLNVNDWREYKDATGTVRRSSIIGIKDINGITTYISSTGDGNIKYRTSDSSGVKYYGFTSPSFTGDIIFSSPLLMAPGTGQIGTSQTSSTVWTFSYSGTIYHVDYTITTTILGLEDVTTAQSTLKDCIKLSTEGTQIIRETGETETETLYAWFYKGVGLVKQVTSTESETITASYIGGILVSYATPTSMPSLSILSTNTAIYDSWNKYPGSLAVDASGDVYVSLYGILGSYNVKLNNSLNLISQTSTIYNGYWGITILSNGDIVVTDCPQ